MLGYTGSEAISSASVLIGDGKLANSFCMGVVTKMVTLTSATMVTGANRFL